MLTLRRSVRLWKRGNLPFLKKLCRCLEKTFSVEMVFPIPPGYEALPLMNSWKQYTSYLHSRVS